MALSINGRKCALDYAWPRVTERIEAMYYSLMQRPMRVADDGRRAARSAA